MAGREVGYQSANCGVRFGVKGGFTERERNVHKVTPSHELLEE